MTSESTTPVEITSHSDVSDHYARHGLIEAIEEGIIRIGKTTSGVTIEDLAAVDEFHIGGRTATMEMFRQLGLKSGDHVLDVGCGLGGPARFAADRYKCQVSGLDLTFDYVRAGNRLSEWVGLSDRVRLYQASALSMPFQGSQFSAAYMFHVGMNVQDKEGLCREVSRVLQPGSLFAIYDVMRTADGELSFPLPWATTLQSNAVESPRAYKAALQRTGFDILTEHNRRDRAIDYFEGQKARASTANVPALGLHTLMGKRRQHQIKNMIECITRGIIAPVELIARMSR